MRIGTRADRGATDVLNTLSARRQQRTKMKRKERKDDDAQQSQNTQGIHVAGEKVLVAPQWVERVSWSESTVFVNLSRETIK